MLNHVNDVTLNTSSTVDLALMIMMMDQTWSRGQMFRSSLENVPKRQQKFSRGGGSAHCDLICYLCALQNSVQPQDAHG